MLSFTRKFYRKGNVSSLIPILRKVTIIVTIPIFVAGCAATSPKASVELGDGHYKVGRPYKINGVWYYPEEDFKYKAEGIASWYGPNFHGKKTANGEKFNQNDLTAAHPTLPLPCVVLVTNLENKKSIKLRVNDRGPYKHKREIDVSKKAAEELGFKHKGLAKVRVEVLTKESLELKSKKLAQKKSYKRN